MSGVALITLREGTPDLDPAMARFQQHPSPQQQPNYPSQSHQHKNSLISHCNSADTTPNYTARAASYLKMKPADHFPAGLRILAVDDDPISLAILRRMLQECSYHGVLLTYLP